MFVARIAALAAAALFAAMGAASVADAKTLRWASQGDAPDLGPACPERGSDLGDESARL